MYTECSISNTVEKKCFFHFTYYAIFAVMLFIDTHTHLYVEEFCNDSYEVVNRAIEKGIHYMLFPNIDSTTVEDMMALHLEFPDNCLPMMGLHPTSVTENFEEELQKVANSLQMGYYCGVGEIGLDLYWDKQFKEQQKEAFGFQLRLAKKFKLPVSIHIRNAFDLALSIVKEELTDDLSGVFHCFTGDYHQAKQIMDVGFKIGIGGIITFKNSGLYDTVKKIPLNELVLETDAPYLTPVPFRGKRNESAYLTYVAEIIAKSKGLNIDEVARTTSRTASLMYNLKR